MTVFFISLFIFWFSVWQNEEPGRVLLSTRRYCHRYHTLVMDINFIYYSEYNRAANYKIQHFLNSKSTLSYHTIKTVVEALTWKIQSIHVFTCDCQFEINFLARESHGGQRLIRKADFNAGSNVSSMFRVRCKLYDPSSDKRMTGAPEKRHITYFGM